MWPRTVALWASHKDTAEVTELTLSACLFGKLDMLTGGSSSQKRSINPPMEGVFGEARKGNKKDQRVNVKQKRQSLSLIFGGTPGQRVKINRWQ